MWNSQHEVQLNTGQWRSAIKRYMCTLLYLKQMTNRGELRELGTVLCGSLDGWGIGYMCVCDPVTLLSTWDYDSAVNWLRVPACSVVRLFATPWTIAHQTPLSKNTGVGCHFPPQGILQTQRSKPRLLHLLHWQVDSLPPHHLGSPINWIHSNIK